MLKIILVILSSYLIGAIPFSIIISRLFRKIDIREYGSKNPGATNVFRVVGPLAGSIVLILDIAKGFFAVYFLTRLLGVESLMAPIYGQLLAGVAVISGHVFSIFTKFKGGKGIAVGAGVFLALIPLELMLGVAVFAIILATTKYVSLASLSASTFICLSLMVEKYLLKQNLPLILILTCFILTLLVFYTHRGNIERLLNGTESRINQKVNI
ncbi:MAG TPA: glycerol-3-phosphate 1-O-acyltransferase PlsY [candidate division Zixibacteria bacterium]|nr:glycerol-3-phosphate 1-O-acyltransferase PlsY [candidate division Zixibacteria bacterium]